MNIHSWILHQATLFSAILTAFLIDVRGRTPPISSFNLVNGFWFTSLILSVMSAFIATVAKGWIMNIIDTDGEIWAAAGARQRRFNDIRRLKIKDLLKMIPLIIHGSLSFFCLGLIFYLHDDLVAIRASILVLVILMAIFYVIFTLLPLFHKDSPLNTPLFILFRALKECTRKDKQAGQPPSDDHLKADALIWLLTTSADSTVIFDTVQAIAGLKIDKEVQKVLLREQAVARTLSRGYIAYIKSKDHAKLLPYIHAIRRLVQPEVPPTSIIFEPFHAPLDTFPIYERGTYDFAIFIAARMFLIGKDRETRPPSELLDTAIPLLRLCSAEPIKRRLSNVHEGTGWKLPDIPQFGISSIERGLSGALPLRKQYAQSLASLLKHSNYL